MAAKGKKRFFSIRYKFLVTILAILLVSLSVFFGFAYRTFSEDKQLFLTDLNLTVLRSASNEIRADFRRRIYELQTIFPVLHDNYRLGKSQSKREEPLPLLSSDLRSEIFALTFYELGRGSLKRLAEYPNFTLIGRKGVSRDFAAQLEEQSPLPVENLAMDRVFWFNRSQVLKHGNSVKNMGVLSLVFVTRAEKGNRTFVVVADLSQDFLRRKLGESEVAEMFLIQSDGTLLSHANPETTSLFANQKLNHPILEKINEDRQLPLVSFQLDIGGESYLSSFAQTGFPGIYLISQVSRAEAFAALNLLFKRFIFLALVIVCVAVIVSVLVAGKLTFNIQKMKRAAERMGRGEFGFKLGIQTNDEVQRVSESMEWMGQQISNLLLESEERARMKSELETAQLVQSTLMSSPELESDTVDLVSYYSPATECGGDFLDATLRGEKLTLLIGDATGHGASAALLTAAAKSFSATLDLLYGGQPADYQLSVEQKLWLLNSVIYKACRGQLLMTLCLVELNLKTGEVILGNAGHEAPMRMKAEEFEQDSNPSHRKAIEVLFSRGERVGFDPSSTYTSKKFQLSPGDTVLIYTDGITEATNAFGREWGERQLKKTLTSLGNAPLRDMSASLASAVFNHLGDREPDDDITFALFRWKEPQKAALPPPQPRQVKSA